MKPAGTPAGTLSTAPRRGSYPVVLPTWRDARLAQSAVLLTLQVLGQTVLGFNVSVPQILVCLGTCALLELAIVARRQRVIMWPASALLTGNGVALLLRHPATAPAEHWNTAGLGLFAAVAGGSLLSKYVLRWGGQHIFNPSNVGLVGALLVLGSERADLQELYWGPWRPGLAAALVLIVVGAAVVGRRAGVLAVGVMYLIVLNVAFGLLAVTDQCIVAPWHPRPLCGLTYWWRVALSPETLVFAAFMITDPRTVPTKRWPRVAFAATAGWLAAVFAAPQHSEFATKVAILGGLTTASAALFAFRLLRSRGGTFAAAPSGRIAADSLREGAWGRLPALSRPTTVVAALVVAGGALVAIGSSTRGDTSAPSATAAMPQWPPGLSPPTVAIAGDVAPWAPWFRPRDAELRSRALLVDLERQRSATGGAPRTYLSITVLMVKVPESRQDSPEVGLELRSRTTDGVEHTDWYRLERQGESYVIAGTGEPWVD